MPRSTSAPAFPFSLHTAGPSSWALQVCPVFHRIPFLVQRANKPSEQKHVLSCKFHGSFPTELHKPNVFIILPAVLSFVLEVFRLHSSSPDQTCWKHWQCCSTPGLCAPQSPVGSCYTWGIKYCSTSQAAWREPSSAYSQYQKYCKQLLLSSDPILTWRKHTGPKQPCSKGNRLPSPQLK